MLPSAILLAPDANTGRKACDELSLALGIDRILVVDHYPSGEELPRLLHTHMPNVIFIHGRIVELATACATFADQSSTGALIVAIDVANDPEVYLRLFRSGVREILPFPATNVAAFDAIQSIKKLVERSKPGYPTAAPVYCFLPAKPGVGASTIAVNTALAASGATDKGVLLCDLDTHVGMSSFLLSIPSESSIRTVIECGERLDEHIWEQLVVSRGGLHVLGPGSLGGAPELESSAVAAVIRFASRLYDAILIDLSGNLEPFCIDLLRSAKQIFLVCTHEVAALHLGRMKAEALKAIGVGDRVSVLLNRSESGQALSIKELEKLLEFRVRHSFSNDYKRVNAAAMTHGGVNERSDLGKQFKHFSESLVTALPPDKRSQRRRFIEFFSVKTTPFSVSRGQR